MSKIASITEEIKLMLFWHRCSRLPYIMVVVVQSSCSAVPKRPEASCEIPGTLAKLCHEASKKLELKVNVKESLTEV